MLINIDGERNKKVEELLNEGMSFIQNNISNYKKPSNSKTEINTKSINYENYSIENYNEYNKTINNANKINNTNGYIYYNGQNTELINNTIQALNTGLNYLEKNNINDSGEKKKNYFLKRAQKKLITKKENISKNINDKKIDLKTKLINKVKTPINKGIKKKSFEKIYSSIGYNNNLVLISRTYKFLLHPFSSSSSELISFSASSKSNKFFLFFFSFKLKENK